MSGNPSILPASSDDVYAAVAAEAMLTVADALARAGGGQRLRVTTLPEPVLRRLCPGLQGDARWVVRMLVPGSPDADWQATATKVIELRNRLAEPLLVLIPPGLRTAAEDSLDVATFTELSFAGLSKSLARSLADRLPPQLRPRVDEALSYLRQQKLVRNTDQEVRYLLTVLNNSATASAAGGAIYVFGLVPDFALFERPGVPSWLSRNEKARAELADIRRPLQERIAQLPIRPGPTQKELFTFLRQRHADDITGWAADIACQPSWRHLSLDQWPFKETGHEEGLRVILEPLSLPRQNEDAVGGAVRMSVLDLDTKQTLKVTFQSIPPAAQVTAWKTFRIQLLAYDPEQPTVAWQSNSYTKPGGRLRQASRTIKGSDLAAIEEGTYFVRLEAYDQGGAVLTQRRPLDPSNPDSRDENESELFLVVRGGDPPDAPPEPRAVNVPSLFDAWMTVCEQRLGRRKEEPFPDPRSLTGTWMEPTGSAVRGEAHFHLAGDGVIGFNVVVPGVLRKVELAVLEHPESLGTYSLDFTGARTAADVVLERRQGPAFPAVPAAHVYLDARAKVFAAMRRQHISRRQLATEGSDAAEVAAAAEADADRLSIVETADLVGLAEEIETYASTYVELVEQTLAADRSFVQPGARAALGLMDVLELRWRPSPGDPGRALLMAPTHPLRLLWHLQHARFCVTAIQDCRETGKQAPVGSGFLTQVRRSVLPVNLPMALFDDRGRGYVEQGPLTSHWCVYLPDRADGDQAADTASCRDRVRDLLGVRGQAFAPPAVGGADVARRVVEYLEQHPYAEQIRINVFNPGDGQVVADALRAVEGYRLRLAGPGVAPPGLRYSVQMFGLGEQLDAMGDAVESLLDPERQVSDDDEFTLTSSNHLLPKLVFGRNAVRDFVLRPADYPAHLSVFLEHFSVRCRLGSIAPLARGSYVAGLVQEPDLHVEDGAGRLGWYRGLRPGGRSDAPRAERLLEAALTATQLLGAAAAAGEVSPPAIAPVVALQLDQAGLALLKHVHAVSDWVLTVDRYMGIELFDSPASGDEAGYLLDFTPETLQEGRQRLVLTTRSTTEVEGIVRPALERFGFAADRRSSVTVLETIRSLSGRLALRLLSAPNQVAEVIGLMLARWLLERADLLQDRVVIPLDAHRPWFQPGPKGDGPGGQQRADLLLVGFDLPARRIAVTVVEVKLRESLTDSAREHLYAQMREQSENTAKVLRERFDPDLYPVARPDFLLRAKELTTTLTFYTRRAQRYGLIGSEAAEAAIRFAQDLDAGYGMSIECLGIVFEAQTVGIHMDNNERGFPVHRFGLDVARELYQDAMQVSESRTVASDTPVPQVAEGPPTTVRRGTRDPRLDSFRSSVGHSALRVPPTGTRDVPQATDVEAERLAPPEAVVAGPAPVDDEPAPDSSGSRAAMSPADSSLKDVPANPPVVDARASEDGGGARDSPWFGAGANR